MRFAGPGIALVVTTVATAAGAAEQNFPGPGLAIVDGKCSKLVVGKLDASKNCKAEIASVTAPDGTVTFIFSADGKMLGFQGDGRTIKAGEKKGTAQLPIEVVSTGAGNKMTGQVEAKGTCTFANPYSGKPVAIECSAKSTAATFTGSFKSNGKPPHGR